MVSDCFSKRTANNKSSSKLKCVWRKTKRRDRPAALPFVLARRYQRRSCNTLSCDWLARASAETAIDWRVESAWLLAASSLVSASVRFEAPVCSTLIRFLLKSWRICTIERFEPSAEDSPRSVVEAACSEVSTLFAELLSRKSTPAVSVASPRPASLKVTPWIDSVERP